MAIFAPHERLPSSATLLSDYLIICQSTALQKLTWCHSAPKTANTLCSYLEILVEKVQKLPVHRPQAQNPSGRSFRATTATLGLRLGLKTSDYWGRHWLYWGLPPTHWESCRHLPELDIAGGEAGRGGGVRSRWWAGWTCSSWGSHGRVQRVCSWAAMELHGFVGLGVAAMPMAAPHGPATSLQITTSPPPPSPPSPPPLPPEINPIISTLRVFECKSSASWHFITCATSIAFLIFANIDVSNKKWW